MRILHPTDPAYVSELAKLDRIHVPADDVCETVREILCAVRDEGDAAVLRYTAKFGGPQLPDGAALRVQPEEFTAALKAIDPAILEALRAAHVNVGGFARKGLRKDWQMHNAEGATVGERFRPFDRVGLYVPGGSAPLVSTAIMTCAFAQAAGCREIVVCTPADRDNALNPALLVAVYLCGATEVYRVGGAQAIGAMACGTASIGKVKKIFGPGNRFVVEAKRQVLGRVAIDLLPGPSEVMVVGDAQANAQWIAADLLAQAEHGADSAMIFATANPAKLLEVEVAIHAQAGSLPRQAQLGPVLEENAVLILARDENHLVEIVNDYAPEHLSLHLTKPDHFAKRIETAGCIFLGGWSPVAAGDFLAGPSHTLPTGGASKSFAGLTADQFQRRTSFVRYDEKSLRQATPIIETFARIEGLEAHGRSARIRLSPSE